MPSPKAKPRRAYKAPDHLKPIKGPGSGGVSQYTAEIAEIITSRLAGGDMLINICTEPGMPDRRTVQRWIALNPDFAAAVTRARVVSADVVDEEIMSIALACTPETAQADRVKIDALRWRAGHLNRARYGDKAQIDVNTTISLPDLITQSIQITRHEVERLMAPTIVGEAETLDVVPGDQ